MWRFGQSNIFKWLCLHSALPTSDFILCFNKQKPAGSHCGTFGVLWYCWWADRASLRGGLQRGLSSPPEAGGRRESERENPRLLQGGFGNVELRFPHRNTDDPESPLHTQTFLTTPAQGPRRSFPSPTVPTPHHAQENKLSPAGIRPNTIALFWNILEKNKTPLFLVIKGN